MLTLLLCFSLVCELEWDPTFAALSVLTQSREEFELDREQTDNMIAVLRSTRDKSGSSPEFSRLLEETLSSRELKVLRAKAFQVSLGNGMLPRALRENRIRITRDEAKELQKAIADAKKVVRSHWFSDHHSTGLWVLEPLVDTDRLQTLQGEPFKFRTHPQLHYRVAWPDEIDRIPLQMALWPEVMVELKLTAKQATSLHFVRDDLIKRETIPEDWEEPADSVEDTLKTSVEIYDGIISYLDALQKKRFEQLLLQRYVYSSPELTVFHLKRMGHEVEKKSREFDRRLLAYPATLRAADHFRHVHHLREVAERFMGDKLVKSLMYPKYVPVILKQQPILEADLFLELGGRKPKSVNPRRAQKLKQSIDVSASTGELRLEAVDRPTGRRLPQLAKFLLHALEKAGVFAHIGFDLLLGFGYIS